MITRFSKCDFRVPGQIVDFKNFVSKKKVFFRNRKNLEKVRNLTKETHWKSLQFRKFPTFSRFQCFQDFFRFRNKNRKTILKIQIFPKIPKIILRKSCDFFKHTNNAQRKNSQFFCLIFPLNPTRFVNLLCTTPSINLKLVRSRQGRKALFPPVQSASQS